MERQVPLDPTGARSAVGAFRALDDPVTGVCAYNDEVALAVLAGLRAHGLSAPTDMAVVGVDNIPAAECAAPPLTTIDFHPAAVGRYLAAVALGERESIPESPTFITVVARHSA